MDLLAIKAVDPDKYALALMEALFTDQEMAASCYSQTKRSTKPPLDEERIALLEGQFGVSYTNCVLCVRLFLSCIS